MAAASLDKSLHSFPSSLSSLVAVHSCNEKASSVRSGLAHTITSLVVHIYKIKCKSSLCLSLAAHQASTPVPYHKATRSISTCPWMRCLSTTRKTPALNRPLAPRGHMTNASLKKRVVIFLLPKIERTHKNYLTPKAFVIPLKLFYYQTFFETWRNEHS